MNFFLPPKPKEDMFVIKFSDGANKTVLKYEITPQVRKSKLLERSWIDINSLEASLNRINSVICPFKEELAKNEKRMYIYLLAGLLMVLILAVIFGIFVHIALAVVMIAIYIGGLIYIVKKYNKQNDHLLKRIHFNVCLLLRNENERFYQRYNLRARVGYLSNWIEFHSLTPTVNNGFQLSL